LKWKRLKTLIKSELFKLFYMKATKKMKQTLTRIQIISSTIWAILIIVCYQILGDSFKEIRLIIICGFFIEFLLINSAKNGLKRIDKDKL